MIRVDPATGAQAMVSSGGSFEEPVGVALEADGNIVVADRSAFSSAGGLIRVDPATGAQATVSSGGLFSRPVGVAVEATATSWSPTTARSVAQAGDPG